MMAVAPWRRPVATREDAAVITGDHGAPGGGRNAAAGMGDLLLELTQSRDPGDGGVAGKPPNGFCGERSAPFELTRRPSIPARVSRLALIINCGRGPAPSGCPGPMRAWQRSTSASASRWSGVLVSPFAGFA